MKKYIISNKSFTLIEVLVSIGIVAVLTTAIVINLNPTEFLKQSRDSNRMSDLQTINKVLSLYLTDGGSSFGSSSVIYISIPDASSTCANLGLPSPNVGWSYSCSTPDNYRKIDGTGWIPINFNNISFNSPLRTLPIDPINTTSSNLYYTYTKGSWKLTAIMESNKYGPMMSIDNGSDSSAYEVGNDLSLDIGFERGGSSSYAYSFTDDGTATSTSGIATGGGFGNGTISSTTISGSGTGASISLSISNAANTWTTLANMPGTTANGGTGLTSDQNGYVYAFQGNSTAFWRYSVTSNTWTTLATTSATVGSLSEGGTLISDQNDIYAFQGGSNVFWKYSIASNTWTTLSNAPGAVSNGSLTYDQATNDIYAFRGNNTTAFWKYSIASSTWTTATSTPQNIPYANVLASGQNGNIYGFRANSTTDFWKYSIASSTWTSLTNSTVVNGGGSIAYDQQGNIYVHIGQSLPFKKYSISSGVWTSLADAPTTEIRAITYYQNGIYALQRSSNVFYKYSITDNYYFSGAFTSASINLGAGATWTTISWDATLNSQTIAFKARSDADGNFSNAPAWSSCSNLTNGGNLSAGGCVTNGHQYIQYQIAFSTSNGSATPSLNSVTINYSQ